MTATTDTRPDTATPGSATDRPDLKAQGAKGTRPQAGQAAREFAEAAQTLSTAGTEAARATVDAVVETSRAAAETMRAAAQAATEATQEVIQAQQQRTEWAAGVGAPGTGKQTEAAMRFTNLYLERSTQASRAIFDAWTSGAEASLRAALSVQTAALSAGLSLLDAANAANRDAVSHWSALSSQAREAAMTAWQTNLRTMTGAATPTARR